MLRQILCWIGFGHKPNSILAGSRIDYCENNYGNQYKCVYCGRWIIDLKRG